jgi:hypothetical protein
VSLRQKLQALAGKPMAPKRGPVPQAPCDIGLGACPRAGLWPDPGNEDARNQFDLLDRLRAADPGHAPERQEKDPRP